MESKLQQAYDPETFNRLGHELVELLTRYLSDSKNKQINVLDWKEPEEQLAFWRDYELDGQPLTRLFEDILKYSNHMHHPRYLGHQVSPAMPVTALAGFLGDFVNNGMAVYEVGPSATAIEKLVVEHFLERLGFSENGDGSITSGGTLANLTALLAARKAVSGTDVWEDGHGDKLAVMVSDEAHYCIDRACRIMGLGSEGIVKIPVNKNYHMDVARLEDAYRQATQNGFRIMAVVGSAPSTATGMFDDLEAIGRFCQKHGLWFHVDGAHGGAAIFSEKYRQLLNGIDMADSVVIDGHKMMLMPVITTLLLFKNKIHSYSTFSQKALYLWEDHAEEEWFNISRKTFECTKLMMSIKYFAAMKAYGPGIFDEHVTRAFDLGRTFGEKILNRKGFELFLKPHCNIVVFRYTGSLTDDGQIDRLNTSIRSAMVRKGAFYVVQTRLENKTWLRTSLMNPLTGTAQLDELLDHIEALAKQH
jgi:L-2,4-diaminobutyrate decarboxylase